MGGSGVRVVRMVCAGAILAAAAGFLATRGGPMARAALLLDPNGVAAGLGLCLLHRVGNATGWGLVLASLGTPVRVAPAARLWLAAEACRWIPGSVWAFGSRAWLAAVRGVPLRVASVSVVLEMLATVAAWGMVALLGADRLPLASIAPAPIAVDRSVGASAAATLGLAVLLVVAGATRRRARSCGTAPGPVADLLAVRPRAGRLAGAVLFYAVMATLNGLILVVLVRSLATAGVVPVRVVVAANAVAWLAGFLAIVAPGGLVVREACLVGLLSPWLPAEQALVVASAWRLVQVAAEMLVFAAVTTTGLPSVLLRGPIAPRSTELAGTRGTRAAPDVAPRTGRRRGCGRSRAGR